MSKKPENITEEENIGNVGQTPLVIHRQYLKDMSFEAPNSPEVLKPANTRPEMDMNILIDVQKLESEEFEYLYEVVLTINVTASRDDKTLFLTEVIYGTTASITGLEEKKHHPLLFIEVPQMMFPFARQIVANATASGAFNPLQLAPVDFRSMYLARFAPKKFKKAQEQASDEVKQNKA
jgi:preprotein translocase subunit SecB